MLKMEVKTLNQSFYHYGVLGMKWGVRKDRTSPSFSERRQVRKLKSNYKAATKNLARRVGMADDDRENVNVAEKEYVAAQKKGRGLTKKTREKRNTEIQNAEVNLNKKLDALAIGEANQRRAENIYDSKRSELEDYVKSLVDKYGDTNVKQLKERKTAVNAGRDYVIEHVYRTGIRINDIPFIGSRVTGRQITDFERDVRNESLKEEVEERAKYYKTSKK